MLPDGFKPRRIGPREAFAIERGLSQAVGLMLSDPHEPTPLPAAWPYTQRQPLPPLGCREHQRLPGLGGHWRVCSPNGEVPGGSAEPLGGAGGRGGILRAGDIVLRPYLRGGWVRFLNERTYASPLRFAAEFAVHRALWEAGFPTVEPLGYAWRRRRLGVEGVFLTHLAQGEPWPRHWNAQSERLALVDQALDALCAWGLWAPDLNATNILMTPSGGILMLDWDRARFQPNQNLRSRYEARLLRSLKKLGAPESLLHRFRIKEPLHSR